MHSLHSLLVLFSFSLVDFYLLDVRAYLTNDPERGRNEFLNNKKTLRSNF
jgi:hypothetical protein